jgi:heme/copper-type cytochrome/quinol oxidase subunit 2
MAPEDHLMPPIIIIIALTIILIATLIIASIKVEVLYFYHHHHHHLPIRILRPNEEEVRVESVAKSMAWIIEIHGALSANGRKLAADLLIRIIFVYQLS